MGNAYFITCLAPFHLEESSYTITQRDAAASFASLAYDIQKLQKALTADSLTLQWCTDAVILLKKMHLEFLMLFQSLEVSISWNGISKLFDVYMHESLYILELCNLLKSATSEMNRYLLKIDIDVRSISNGESFADINKLDKKGIKSYDTPQWKNLDHFKVSLHKNTNKNSTTNSISALNRAINIISSILFCAIFYPIPVEIEKEIYCKLPQMKLFQDSIQDLTKCFNNKLHLASGNFYVAFVEHEMIEKAITDTKSQHKKKSVADRAKLERTKAFIQQKTAALKGSLEVFESEVAKVFEEVLKGRNKLLKQITTSSKT